MARFLPILLVLFSLAAGGGAALFLRGGTEAGAHGGTGDVPVTHSTAEDAQSKDLGYYKFSRPFIVPVVAQDEVVALAMLSLSVEMGEAEARTALVKEPKVRDGFMRVLIGLSHDGYFEGDITDPDRFAEIRNRLKAEAESLLGGTVADVLIVDYARQTR